MKKRWKKPLILAVAVGGFGAVMSFAFRATGSGGAILCNPAVAVPLFALYGLFLGLGRSEGER